MSIANFNMSAGDTKVISVVVADPTGNPIDLTDATIQWQLAQHASSNASIISKSIGDGIVITDVANGLYQITILPADTVSLGDREYYHESKITLQSGAVALVFSGKIRISRSLISQ